MINIDLAGFSKFILCDHPCSWMNKILMIAAKPFGPISIHYLLKFIAYFHYSPHRGKNLDVIHPIIYRKIGMFPNDISLNSKHESYTELHGEFTEKLKDFFSLC
jgi:hypothetical protein